MRFEGRATASGARSPGAPTYEAELGFLARVLGFASRLPTLESGHRARCGDAAGLGGIPDRRPRHRAPGRSPTRRAPSRSSSGSSSLATVLAGVARRPAHPRADPARRSRASPMGLAAGPAPSFELEPELVFLFFLPPILYSGGLLHLDPRLQGEPAADPAALHRARHLVTTLGVACGAQGASCPDLPWARRVRLRRDRLPTRRRRRHLDLPPARRPAPDRDDPRRREPRQRRDGPRRCSARSPSSPWAARSRSSTRRDRPRGRRAGRHRSSGSSSAWLDRHRADPDRGLRRSGIVWTLLVPIDRVPARPRRSASAACSRSSSPASTPARSPPAR